MSWERGLIKVGDALIPGNERMPSFSASGAIRYAKTAFGALGEADRDALLLVVRVLGSLPRSLIGGVFLVVGTLKFLPGPLGAVPRLLWVGLRGLVLSLYYSDPRVRELIGWDRKHGSQGA